MKCRICGADLKVTDTRELDGKVHRRRKCPVGHQCWTEETVQPEPPREALATLMRMRRNSKDFTLPDQSTVGLDLQEMWHGQRARS